MSSRTSRRFGVALLLAVLMSGCALWGDETGEGPWQDAGASRGSAGECQWNRSRCLYEGAYEPGERAYAEEEARNLNRAALERLRRNTGR